MISQPHNGVHAPGVPYAPKGLLPHHWNQLRASGITEALALRAGLKSETDHGALASLLGFRKYPSKNGAALVFPYLDRHGAEIMRRVRPDNTPQIGGKPAKYLSPKGATIRLYFPPGVLEALDNLDQPMIVSEGEKKALCATGHGFPCVGMPGVRCFNKKKASALLADFDEVKLHGRRVYIAHDSDIATNESVQEAEKVFAALLITRGALVKVVRIPAGDDGNKQGLDDFIVAKGSSEFAKLLERASDPSAVDPEQMKTPAAELDPAGEAADYIKARTADGVCKVRYWRGSFVRWSHGCYIDVSASEVRCDLVEHLNQKFFKLAAHMTSNVMDQVKAKTLLLAAIEQPAWLNRRQADWSADGVLSARNGLVRIADLADGKPEVIPPTPRFFTPTALPCEVNADAKTPDLWMKFLNDLWPADLASIETLQEWFGYCLVSDTSQQKILMLVGPKRSGKGTIARTLRALVGNANVAGPTLSSFSHPFGLWPLLNKSLAIISDARLSGRTDSAIVVERLLSISGEDPLTVERKNLEAVTCTLPTRLMILTNELPRLGDASGAMTSRIILLHMTQSFYGKEDHGLTDKLLAELPGILLWAAAGWKRLNDRGYFVQPTSAKEALDDLDDLTSPVGAFVRDCCLLGEAYRASVADLYAEWAKWCETNGRREPGTQQMFGRDLAASVTNIKRVQPRDEEGSRYRAYEGIAIRATSSLGF